MDDCTQEAMLRCLHVLLRPSTPRSGGPGSIPTTGVRFFSAMLHSFVATFMS